MHPDLIYDIGAHKGDDTAFYLKKGFRVIAVEANPALVSHLRSRFSTEIADKTVMVEACAIADSVGELNFYAHHHDDWSTLDLTSRFVEGNYEIVRIVATTIEDLVFKYGVPYYLKADIEGAERHIIDHFHLLPTLPPYISFEDNAYTDSQLVVLLNLGYENFKIIEQAAKAGQEEAPFPPREGGYVPFRFTSYMSGAFGKELPGEWVTYTWLKLELEKIRTERKNGIWGRWYDIHCQHSTLAISYPPDDVQRSKPAAI